jgi:fido (protein-threonine AMPylation protein)
VRFHHRLVLIHPFPNGNGRHARLMADLLVIQLGRERFTWGRESLREAINIDIDINIIIDGDMTVMMTTASARALPGAL